MLFCWVENIRISDFKFNSNVALLLIFCFYTIFVFERFIILTHGGDATIIDKCKGE